MSEPTNAQLAASLRLMAADAPGITNYERAAIARLAAKRLEAAPSTEDIIEVMARAIFNAHNRLTPEDSPWHVVPEQTREIFRGIARHELEVGQRTQP